MIRITIDLDRCQGHGRCEAQAPAVFGYGEVTNQSFVLEGADLESNRGEIDRAVADCPESAISLSNE